MAVRKLARLMKASVETLPLPVMKTEENPCPDDDRMVDLLDNPERMTRKEAAHIKDCQWCMAQVHMHIGS
jgi:hypothetical protein